MHILILCIITTALPYTLFLTDITELWILIPTADLALLVQIAQLVIDSSNLKKYMLRRLTFLESKNQEHRLTFLELMNQAVHELGLVEKVKDQNSVISNSTWEPIYKWFQNKTGRKLTPMLEVALNVIARDLNSEDGCDSKIGIRSRKAINEWFESDFIDPISLRMIVDDLAR